MKIVLDTSVLISGIFWRGIPGQVLDGIVAGRISLLVTPPIITEYLRVIKEIAGAHDPELMPRWARFFSESATLVEPSSVTLTCRDKSDQMFLECAVGGNATMIVAGDRDLLSLHALEQIPIVTSRQFIQSL